MPLCPNMYKYLSGARMIFSAGVKMLTFPKKSEF